GARVVGLAVREAVGAAVDQARDLEEIAGVGRVVDVAAGPVPGGDAGGVLGPRGQLRVVDQVQPQGPPGLLVVVAAGDLDVAAALVAHAVAGLGVAQVRAALVGGAAGELLHEAEAAALVRELGDEHRLLLRGGDVGLGHGGVEVPGDRRRLAGVERRHDLHELGGGDAAGRAGLRAVDGGVGRHRGRGERGRGRRAIHALVAHARNPDLLAG